MIFDEVIAAALLSLLLSEQRCTSSFWRPHTPDFILPSVNLECKFDLKSFIDTFGVSQTTFTLYCFSDSKNWEVWKRCSHCLPLETLGLHHTGRAKSETFGNVDGDTHSRSLTRSYQSQLLACPVSIDILLLHSIFPITLLFLILFRPVLTCHVLLYLIFSSPVLPFLRDYYP